MKHVFSMGVLLLMVSTFGCHSSSPTVDGKTHVFTLKQKCPTLLDMKVGQSLMFHAPENVSTGYEWQLSEPLHLFSVDESDQAPRNDEQIVGQETEKIYEFKAQQPGEEEIEVKYIRPGEATAPPAEHWYCRVRIS